MCESLGLIPRLITYNTHTHSFMVISTQLKWRKYYSTSFEDGVSIWPLHFLSTESYQRTHGRTGNALFQRRTKVVRSRAGDDITCVTEDSATWLSYPTTSMNKEVSTYKQNYCRSQGPGSLIWSGHYETALELWCLVQCTAQLLPLTCQMTKNHTQAWLPPGLPLPFL